MCVCRSWWTLRTLIADPVSGRVIVLEYAPPGESYVILLVVE